MQQSPIEKMISRLEKLSVEKCRYSELSSDLYEQGYSDCMMHMQEYIAEVLYLYSIDVTLESRTNYLTKLEELNG